MSVSILKNWESHYPKKVLADLIMIAFDLKLMLHYNNNVTYFNDGLFQSVSLNIIDDVVQINPDNDKQFHFYVKGVDKEFIDLGGDKDFDWVKENGGLCKLCYIESMNMENTMLIYKFMFEYLNRNRNDYFLFDGNRVIGWDGFKCSKNPLDINWINPIWP